MENGDEMRKIKESDEAVVGIVVTVLLIGLILAVTVMINTVYVPQWIEESEAAHMEEVSNQFAQLKYAIDIQSIVNDSTAMSTSITLGNKEIPFFNSGRTFDYLEVVENSCKIIIERNGTSINDSYLTSSIKYSSGNSYFVEQSYIYETGALILSQYSSSMLYGKPSILVTEYGKNLSFTIVNVTGVCGKTFVSGYGTYPIYTSITNYNGQYDKFKNVTNITLITNYPNAWRIAVNSSLLHSGFEYDGDGVDEVGYNLTSTSDRITLKFIDSSGDYVNLFIREVDISAQIAFGLAE